MQVIVTIGRLLISTIIWNIVFYLICRFNFDTLECLLKIVFPSMFFITIVYLLTLWLGKDKFPWISDWKVGVAVGGMWIAFIIHLFLIMFVLIAICLGYQGINVL
ncbi:MAG: hypothetical protein GXO48_03050 [Chlorobi bacterium]|nr:hypothetical protein [Chlorobiota bacterium]